MVTCQKSNQKEDSNRKGERTKKKKRNKMRLAESKQKQWQLDLFTQKGRDRPCGVGLQGLNLQDLLNEPPEKWAPPQNQK